MCFTGERFDQSNFTAILSLLGNDTSSINRLLDNEDYFDSLWMIKFVPSILIYVAVFVVGTIGNLLVILSICLLKRLQTITNLFLTSLATADLLLIIICVPIKITEFFTHSWVFGSFMCTFYHYMQFFTAICSVMNLTAMSIERYVAILYPLKAKSECTRKRAKLIIIFIWVCSSISALPITIGKRLIKVGMHPVDVCYRVWDPVSWKLFETYRSLLILVVPMFIMTFTYVRVCLTLWKLAETREKLTQSAPCSRQTVEGTLDSRGRESLTLIRLVNVDQDTVSNSSRLASSINCISKIERRTEFRAKRLDDLSTRKQIIKMLICIIILFFIGWAPLIVNNLLTAFCVLSNLNTGILWYMRLVFYALSYINSCVNPIVYTFMSRNFRDAFKQIAKRFCLKPESVSRA
nr:G protein-coupled receptor [Proales similis]